MVLALINFRKLKFDEQQADLENSPDEVMRSLSGLQPYVLQAVTLRIGGRDTAYWRLQRYVLR